MMQEMRAPNRCSSEPLAKGSDEHRFGPHPWPTQECRKHLSADDMDFSSSQPSPYLYLTKGEFGKPRQWSTDWDGDRDGTTD